MCWAVAGAPRRGGGGAGRGGQAAGAAGWAAAERYFSGARIAEVAEDLVRVAPVLAGLSEVAAVLECLAEYGQCFGFSCAVAVLPAQLGGTGGMRDGVMRPRDTQVGQRELRQCSAFLPSITDFPDDVHGLPGAGSLMAERHLAPSTTRGY